MGDMENMDEGAFENFMEKFAKEQAGNLEAMQQLDQGMANMPPGANVFGNAG